MKVIKNSVIVYWLIALLLTTPIATVKIFKETFLGKKIALLFPKDYRMFVKPPDVNVFAKYDFFKDGKLLASVRSDEFLKQKIKDENIFFSYHRIHHVMHFNHFLMFENNYNEWYYNRWKNNQITDGVNYMDYLNENDKVMIDNMFWFGVNYLVKQFPSTDSIRMSVIREPYYLGYDSRQKDRLSHWIGNKTLLTKSVNLKK